MKRYYIKDPFDFYMKLIVNNIGKTRYYIRKANGIETPRRTIKRKY